MWADAIILGYYLCLPMAECIAPGTLEEPMPWLGTNKAAYVLDWGSPACAVDNVYGGQIGIWGGCVKDSLYGLQCGLLVSGCVSSNSFSTGCVYGLQIGTVVANAGDVYGVQCAGSRVSARKLYGVQAAVLCEAEEIHGCQLGIVNRAKRVDGVQIGVYNEASDGWYVQIGLVNRVPTSKLEYAPILNVR